jgi:hypothetical protein
MQVYHDSGRKTRLRSYGRLWTEDMTPIVYPDYSQTSQLRLHITAPVDEQVACLTTSAVKDFAWPG